MTRRMEGRESYRASHGTYPRGHGRWMFEMTSGTETQTYTHTGMYSEAQRAAFQAARNMNANTVRVMS